MARTTHKFYAWDGVTGNIAYSQTCQEFADSILAEMNRQGNRGCINCIACYRCSRCIDCADCYSCEHCVECHQCDYCLSSVKLSRCIGISCGFLLKNVKETVEFDD